MYPGIDLVYYGNAAGKLEYDFVLQPGADSHRIELSYEGVDRMKVDRRGDLVLMAGEQTMRQRKLRVLQDGREIASAYRLTANRHVRFALARYNPQQPLTGTAPLS